MLCADVDIGMAAQAEDDPVARAGDLDIDLGLAGVVHRHQVLAELAELVTPESGGKSFAWTFGWFLRIAIVANAAFYFAIFSFFAYLVGRRRSK